MALRTHTKFALAGAAWAVALIFGLSRLWIYESSGNAAAQPPDSFPTETSVARHDAKLPTLVLLIHPKCPCSRATIEELSKLMTRCQGKLAATVYMVRPEGMPQGWERTGLWESSALIPGVSVLVDSDSVEARRFGATTSGQAILYSADGRLLFSGGITESRGHVGDNDGGDAITALVLQQRVLPTTARTPVYGCQLLNGLSQKEGAVACRKP